MMSIDEITRGILKSDRIKQAFLNKKNNFIPLNLTCDQLLQQLDELFLKSNNNLLTVTTTLRHNSALSFEIKKYTPYLGDPTTTSERVYFLRNNLTEKGKCKTCGNATKFENYSLGYKEFCSVRCVQNNPEIRSKKKQTNLIKYGVENPLQNKEIKEKIKSTNLIKYGVEHTLQNKEVREKGRQSILKRYGVEYVSQNKEIREKIKQTSLIKYGVENSSQNEEIKEKVKQTNLERYGSKCSLQNKQIKEKTKQTNLERYGVENPFGSLEIQNKIKSTNLIKYGVKCTLQNKEIREKSKQTNLKKYGVECPANNEQIKEKIKQANLIKYGVENPLQNEEIREKGRDTYRKNYYNKLFTSERLKSLVKPLFSLEEFITVDQKYKFECLKCNNIFEDHLWNGKIPRCFNCFPRTYVSKYEDEIYSWLQSLNVQNIIRNIRSIIFPLELDLYLPDHNLAIEFNELYWHSELGLANRKEEYHLNKTLKCQEKGKQLIHIFEDEWIYKQDIVKSIILNKLGLTTTKVYARECVVKLVDSKTAKAFLFDNHLQEPISSKYNFGLYHNDQLVYLISLSKPRFNKNYQYELIRSCGKINTSVIGGFDKLIKHAIKSLNITSLISYVDKRYFDGRGYKNWNLVGTTNPNYYYMKDYLTRESRIKYQKHKLKALFPDVYEENLTEWQNMQLVGYDRIWDCGNMVFTNSRSQYK